jgi:hypothetical protein
MLQYQESPALDRVNLNYGSSHPTYILLIITDDSVMPPQGLGPRQSVVFATSQVVPAAHHSFACPYIGAVSGLAPVHNKVW